MGNEIVYTFVLTITKNKTIMKQEMKGVIVKVIYYTKSNEAEYTIGNNPTSYVYDLDKDHMFFNEKINLFKSHGAIIEEDKNGIKTIIKNLEVTFTELEKKVLRAYLPIQNPYDFAEGVSKINEICMKIFDTQGEFIEINTLKGVIGSLAKKEVLNCDTNGGGASLVWLGNMFRDNKELLDNTINEIN